MSEKLLYYDKIKLIPKIYNIGYLGIGKYTGGSKNKIYRTWYNMFQRCYCEKYLKKNKTYIGCSVDERWHNFQVFAEWYEQNYIYGFVLDKDILVKGNKIYGPDTCCFVPSQINKLFVNRKTMRTNLPIGVHYNKINNNYNVKLTLFSKTIYGGTYNTIEEAFNKYCEIKKQNIFDVVNVYKDKLPKNIFEAIINYKIEITD